MQSERRRFLRIFLSQGILLFFVALCIYFQLTTRGLFFTRDNLRTILLQSSINTVLAVGMTLVIITAGIDLSVGSVLALAGVVSMNVLIHASPVQGWWPMPESWPMPIAIVAAIFAAVLVGAACGLHNGLPITRLGVAPFIATLAVMTIARGGAYLVTDGFPVGPLPREFTRAIGEGSILGVPLLVVVALGVAGCGHLLLTRTSFGRHVYAIGGSEQAARLSGVAVNRVKLIVYSLCGLLAGIAGFLLSGRLGAGDPKSGLGFELNAIAAVVLGGTSLMGGVGSVLGTVLGAVVISSLNVGLVLMGVSEFYQMVIKGYVILMAVVLDQLKGRVLR